MTLDTTQNPFYRVLAWYYKWMFNGKLAEDFCTLFWNTLFSLFLLPFTLVCAFPLWSDSCWVNTTLAGKFFRGIGLYVTGSFMAMLGYGFLTETLKFTFLNNYPLYLQLIMGFGCTILIFLSGILFVGIVGGIIYGCIEGYKILFKPNKYKFQWDETTGKYIIPINNENKLKIMWAAIRNKYCTKIIWK